MRLDVLCGQCSSRSDCLQRAVDLGSTLFDNEIFLSPQLKKKNNNNNNNNNNNINFEI